MSMDTQSAIGQKTNTNNKGLIIGLIILIAIVIIGVIGYFYLEKHTKTPQQKAIENAVNATQKALPDYGNQTAPLQKMPDVNPTSKTNPYKAVKTNPFQ